MKISFETRLILFFSIIFIGILILGVVAFSNSRTTLKTDKLIEHTKDVIAKSEKILSLGKDIVMVSQHYVITGDSAFVGQSSSAKKMVFVYIAGLKDLTRENQVQQVRVDSLNFIMKNAINFSDLYIRARNEDGLEAAGNLIATGRDKLYTDKIADLINRIEGEENYEIVMRKQENSRSVETFNIAFYALLTSVFIFLVVIFFYILENSKKRAKADAELKISTENFKRLFEYAPYPTWVYDLQTLQFLEVNLAAINQYGYSREEFLKMDITVIRPEEEIPNLMESLQTRGETDLQKTWGWKHKLRNGDLIDVEITSQLFNFTGHTAALVIANNITERKETEEAIRQTNHFLDTILENIPNMIFVKDADELRFVRFNKAGEQLLGYSKKDLIGKNDYDFFPKEQADFFTGKDRDVIKKGELLDIPEEPIDTTSGKKFLHTKKIPIADEEGNPLYLLGISEDITEQKIAEQRMKDLNERFLKIFNLSPVAMTISNIDDGRLILVNETFEKLFLMKKEDVIGKTATELKLVSSVDRNEAIQYAEKGSGHGSGMEVKVRRANGELLDTFVSLEIIEIDNRKRLLTATIDITERKKTELRMKELNEQFIKIFNLSPVAMSITNLDDGRITNANESFEELFMIKKEDAIGKTFADLKIRSPEERDEILAHLKKTGGHVREVEMKLRRLDGEIINTLTSVESIEIDNNKFLLSVAMDISDLKKAEVQILHLNTELKRNLEQLQTVNKELESFTYSVSHDLRSPLRIIDGYADMILQDRQDKMDEEEKKNFYVIKNSAQKMGQLIDDLLSLSRLGRKELSIHTVDMNELVEAAIEEFQMSGTITSHPPEIKKENLLPAKCDKGLIQQVWHNLISNAIKYSRLKEKPLIEIGSYKQEDEIVYFVKDNGAGFDMNYVGKLFGIFQRLHKVTEFEGNGVGLAIVKRIIIKHNGKVWAEAKPDEGATFYFSLPV